MGLIPGPSGMLPRFQDSWPLVLATTMLQLVDVAPSEQPGDCGNPLAEFIWHTAAGPPTFWAFNVVKHDTLPDSVRKLVSAAAVAEDVTARIGASAIAEKKICARSVDLRFISPLN